MVVGRADLEWRDAAHGGDAQFRTLFVRHLVVGVGEATFVTIAPAFISDIYPEHRRGRIMSIFASALPMGVALGYIVGGHLGWRTDGVMRS